MSDKPNDLGSIFEAIFGAGGSGQSARDLWDKATTTPAAGKTAPAEAAALPPIRGRRVDGEKYVSAADVLANLIAEGKGESRVAKQLGKYLYG